MGFLGRHYIRLFRFVPLIEGALLFLSVYLALHISVGIEPSALEAQGVRAVWPAAAAFATVMLLFLTMTGFYNIRLREMVEGVILRAFLACLVGAVVLASMYYIAGSAFLGGGVLTLAVVVAFCTLALSRSFLGKLVNYPMNWRRVLVLGAGSKAAWLTRLRRRTDLIGLKIVGFVPLNGESPVIPAERLVAVEGALSEWVMANRIDEVVVAADERRRVLAMEELMRCRAHGVLVTDLNSFIERETGSVRISEAFPGWLAFSSGPSALFVGDWAKRLLDVAVSVVLLLAAAPVMALAAVAIWLESGGRGSILYKQKRVRRNGEEFDVYKFRSMCEDAEKPGEARWASREDPRITRVGAVLRRFRIDELPQIYNVLRGDMSFVGPRPERPEFVSHLQQVCPFYGERHRVKPGLTGWAQIQYPYGASEEDAVEKLQYDLYYVKNRSLFLDLVILLQTAEVVLWGRGAR